MRPNFQLEKVCKIVAEYAYCLILKGRCRGTTTSQFFVQEVKRYFWRTCALSNLLIATRSRAEGLLLDMSGRTRRDLGQYCLAAGAEEVLGPSGGRWLALVLITEGVFTSGVNTCVQSVKSTTQNISILVPFGFLSEGSFTSLTNENTASRDLTVFSCRHETYREGTAQAIRTCSSVLRNACSKVTFTCSKLTLHIWRYTTFQHLRTLCEVMYRPAG